MRLMKLPQGRYVARGFLRPSRMVAAFIYTHFAASTMMLLTVMLIVVPWAMLEFGGSKKHG